MLQAFISLCDILIMFGKYLTTAASPQFESLVYEPDRHFQLQLTNVLTDRVFIEDQSKCDLVVVSLYARY